jgi:hypothetical protein
MTRRRIIAMAVAAVALLITATALAAPDRNGTIAVNGPAFAWDGGPLTGAVATAEVGDSVPCDVPGKDCDDTLLKVDQGQVSVKISSTDPNSADLDLYTYRSDASGAAGKFVKSSTGPDATEQVTFNGDAGYYLVRVVPATAAGGTFKGQASELPPIPQPPITPPDYGTDPSTGSGGSGSGSGTTTTGGGTNGSSSFPADDHAPSTKVATPSAKKRIRSLHGTASDSDGSVAYVDVALVRIGAKTCKGLTVNGNFKTVKKCAAPRFLRAKGGKTWSLKLKHALTPGKYAVFARATDDQGRPEGGFGPANRRTFTVK